jgi:hypothetical protein
MPRNKYRKYYSVRTAKKTDGGSLDLTFLRRLFKDIYFFFRDENYFQEAFGYECLDNGLVAGSLGFDIEAHILRRLRKSNIWPIDVHCLDYSEDDLFDAIEFLYDLVSKPTEGYYHDYGNCGWHYKKFDTVLGQKEFSEEINDLLQDYRDGYKLSENGEILELGEKGLDYLLEANLSTYDPENIEQKVNSATFKFRRYKSSIEDRKDAVRSLADVLEFIRPKLSSVITKSDEKDLFNIANNFGVRHHNEDQKKNFDKPIWYSWMFYYYLATIHATIRLIKKYEEENAGKKDQK